ncbi:winged helix-turn-helix domain-containing protein [Candidatus Saccharibacteria bacterium]|nr:winged helix-turn-helix domain-containing protein [Candidatus Saccharibacteria bacterium]
MLILSANRWTNTVDVHVKYLRDKIDRPYGSSLLQKVHGVGYKIDVSRQTSSLMDTATGSQ